MSSLQLLDLIILLLVAFVPSLIYLVWIRNTERFNKEPYRRVIIVFALGATVSVVLAVLAELFTMTLYDQNAQRFYQVFGNDPNLETLLLACVVAPFVEEFAKALGVFRVRRFMAEIEDGIVYGAAAGLGFAATENLLYEGSALLSSGVEVFIATVVVRSLSSALLHASASSIFGLGIARSALQRRGWGVYYLGAVFAHSMFNLFASFGELFKKSLGQEASLFGLAAAFMIAIGGIMIARAKIRQLEQTGGV